MRAVIDSSTWISLARAGLLHLPAMADLEPVLVDVVHAEVVAQGKRGGHPDATALEAALANLSAVPTGDVASPVDAIVIEQAEKTGLLVANDLALGRRARSLGVPWIRTADVVVVAVRRGSLPKAEGIAAVDALEGCGRVSPELAAEYREQLG